MELLAARSRTAPEQVANAPTHTQSEALNGEVVMEIAGTPSSHGTHGRDVIGQSLTDHPLSRGQ